MSATIPSSHSSSGKERLQRALIRLSRAPRPGRPGRRGAGPQPDAKIVLIAAPTEVDSVAGGSGDGPALPVELLELVDRLDNIADRLADLEQPGRPLPATRELFGEWVRLRKWEEIPFLEFLTLRRAGRV